MSKFIAKRISKIKRKTKKGKQKNLFAFFFCLNDIVSPYLKRKTLITVAFYLIFLYNLYVMI